MPSIIRPRFFPEKLNYCPILITFAARCTKQKRELRRGRYCQARRFPSFPACAGQFHDLRFLGAALCCCCALCCATVNPTVRPSPPISARLSFVVSYTLLRTRRPPRPSAAARALSDSERPPLLALPSPSSHRRTIRAPANILIHPPIATASAAARQARDVVLRGRGRAGRPGRGAVCRGDADVRAGVGGPRSVHGAADERELQAAA